MNNERLSQFLREGDPVEGDGGLSPDEVRAMRRSVLTAIPDRRRRLLPVLALAGALATAMLIAVLVLKPGPAKAPAPPRVAAAPAPPTVQPPLPRLEPTLREETKKTRPAHRRHHPQAAPQTADRVAALESTGNPAEDPETRQIQFSTPGGTRIIWILKSGQASR